MDVHAPVCVYVFEMCVTRVFDLLYRGIRVRRVHVRIRVHTLVSNVFLLVFTCVGVCLLLFSVYFGSPSHH